MNSKHVRILKEVTVCFKVLHWHLLGGRKIMKANRLTSNITEF